MEDKRNFVKTVLIRLKRRYPKGMNTALVHGTPWQLLVATILSAQSQDKQVNAITSRLFRVYSSVHDFSAMRESELLKYIRHVGLYRVKARNIIASAKMIEHSFSGRVPDSMGALTSLPGVGRKTANVVLHEAFGINDGIAIDTHCITVANRLGLAKGRDPERIEATLMGLADRHEWGNLSDLFIALGRDACTARVKRCKSCALSDICPSSNVIK